MRHVIAYFSGRASFCSCSKMLGIGFRFIRESVPSEVTEGVLLDLGKGCSSEVV